MWVRPGEQMIPVADMPKSPFKRKRYVGYKCFLLGMGICTLVCVYCWNLEEEGRENLECNWNVSSKMVTHADIISYKYQI